MKKLLTSKISGPISPDKLKGYSALAGAFLLTGLSAEAAVVYTDVDPDETYNTDGDLYELDVNNDGTPDFSLYVVDFTYPGIFSTTASGATYGGLFRDVFMIPASGNSVAGSYGGTFAYPYALNSGDLIGPALSFQDVTFQSMVYYLAVLDFPEPGSTLPFLSSGNWIGVNDKYLGLKFQIDGDTHYGWARLDCGADHHSFTIKDYAYETIADEPIEAGEVAPPVPEITFTDATVTVSEGAGTATVTVSISESIDCSVDVDLNDALTTATEGADFVFTDPSPLTFTTGGATTQSFTVDISEDLFDEPDETIVLTLNSPVGGEIGAPDEITITINDNDGPPGIAYATASTSVEEADMTVTGTVNIDVADDCSVDVSINPGLTTATVDDDFEFDSPMELNFTAGGATSIDFDVDILEDAIVESDETIVLDLEVTAGGCVLDEPDQFTITITNDDTPPPPSGMISFSLESVSFNEAEVAVSGSVEVDEASDCSVDVVMDDSGTATEGTDFTFSSPETITFTDGGATSATFDINLLGDLAVEGDESVDFKLENVTGGCEIDEDNDEMTLTILDDDQVGVSTNDGAEALVYSFNNSVVIRLLSAGWNEAEINLYDNAGKKIYHAVLLDTETSIVLNDIPDGIYIAQLIVDGRAIEKNIYLGKN